MANSEEKHDYTKINTDNDEPRPIYETVVEENKIESEKQDTEILQKNEKDVDVPTSNPIPPEILQSVTTSNTQTNVPYDSDNTALDGEGHNIKLYIFLGLVFFIFIAGVVFFINMFRKNIRPKNITLTYWGLWEEKSVMDPLIATFQKNNPTVSIEYIKQSPQKYREKLVTQIKDGRGPDIFRFHNTWIPMLTNTIASIPKKQLTNDEFERLFYKIAQNDLNVKTSYYGIPLMIDNLILIYNEDFLKRIGITEPPDTWDEIVSFAKQLTVQGADNEIITSGIALGTVENIEHFSDILVWMMLQNGADLKDVTTPEAVGALERYREFAEPTLNIWSEAMPNNIVAFAEGKVAMIFAPSWEISNIKAINPDIPLKTAKLPLLPGETEPFSISNYWIEGVSRASKHQDLAWKFLLFLKEKDSMTQLYSLESKVRPIGEPYSRVDLKSVMLQNEYIVPVIEQAEFQKTVPAISRTFDNGLNDKIVSYLKDAINDTIKGVSYDEALKTAHTGINAVLSEYNIK